MSTISRSGAFGVLMIGGVPLQGSRALGDWQLARALAQRHRVLYIDPPLFPRTSLRRPQMLRSSRRRRSVDSPATVGLSAFQPLAPVGANRPWGADLGDRVIGRQVRQAASQLERPVVCIVFDPKRGTLDTVPRDALIYWRRDRLSSSANTRHPDHVLRRDAQLTRAADLVTGVSQPLVDEVTGVARRVALVANGCDYEHFATPAPRPTELVSVGRPVIGFAGGVSWRLDMDLLQGVARIRRDWTLLLAGEPAVRVPEEPNIRVMGAQPYEQLPGWVQGFDVGLIPYRTDAFNTAAAPLKLYEYLAAGVPVVSTPLPAVREQPPWVTTAEDARTTVAVIQDLLAARPEPEACQRIAKGNDWHARVRTLEGHIEQLLASFV